MQGVPAKSDDVADTDSGAGKRKSKRRWLQFSLSTLLLVTAGFALCLGLWVDRANRQQRAVDEILAAGRHHVEYEHQRDSSGNIQLDAEPTAPRWLRRLLGEKYFVNVRAVFLYSPTSAELNRLRDLPRLEDLEVIEDPRRSRVTDDSLAQLRGMTRLKRLRISGRAVSDAGMAHLSTLRNLEELELYRTHVSDAGIVQLAGLKRLQVLRLVSSHVTAEGAQELQKALPDLEIDSRPLPSAPDEKNAVRRLMRMGADFDANKDGTVRYVLFEGPQFTDASLEVLEGLPRLAGLKLWRTQVTAAAVEKLRQRLPRLEIEGQEFVFRPVPEESEAVAALRRLGAVLKPDEEGRVEIVQLENPEAADCDLVHLRALPHLRTLHTVAPKVTDAGLKHLAGLPNLSHLYIEQSHVTGSGLTHLGNSKALVWVSLRESPLSGDNLAHLAAFPNLTHLDLCSTPVSDEDLRYLRDCKALEDLHLGNTRVSGAGLVYLAELPLKALRLNDTAVKDESLAHLKDYKSLELLELENTQVTDAGLIHLEAIRSLKTVFLSGSRVSREERTRIEQRFPLRRLPRGGRGSTGR